MSATANKNKAKERISRASLGTSPSLENDIKSETVDGQQTGEVLVENKVMSPQTSSAELEQVQELLFGAQSRIFQTKISNLEQLLQRSIDDLRQNTDKNFSALIEKLEQLNDQLDDKIAAEGRERLARFEELQTSIKEAKQHIDDFQGESGQSQADLEKRFFAQTEQLNQEFTVRNEAILEKLEQVKSNLTDEKTDRSMLAKLLKNMAEQIEAVN